MRIINIDPRNSGTVFMLLKEAALWLNARGVDYWQNWLDPPREHVDWINEGIAHHQFYLVYNGDELVGMFRLQFEDEMFWGAKPDRAGYVHSFTVRRNHCGRGIGYRILDEIVNLLLDRRCSCVRLDCGRGAAKLRDYYKRYGFIEVGVVVVGGEDLVLFEKGIATGGVPSSR